MFLIAKVRGQQDCPVKDLMGIVGSVDHKTIANAVSSLEGGGWRILFFYSLKIPYMYAIYFDHVYPPLCPSLWRSSPSPVHFLVLILF